MPLCALPALCAILSVRSRSLTETVAGGPSGALFVNVEPGPFTVTVTEAATGTVLTTCPGFARAGQWTAVLCQLR